MGGCTSKKREGQNNNKYIAQQSNNQQLQQQYQQRFQAQGQQLNIEQNNQGYNQNPQLFLDLLQQINDLKQEIANKNQYSSPTQQNNIYLGQQLQLQPQQGQGQQPNIEQINFGQIKNPQQQKELLEKMNNFSQSKSNRNDEQIQEEIHRYNYPEKPNSNIKQQKQNKIQCSLHNDKYIELVNTDNKIKQRLMCYQCQYQQKYEEKQIISVDDFLKMLEDQYLDRFLVFEDSELKEQYQKWFKKTQEIEISKCNIKQLEEFKVKVTQHIEEFKAKMTQHIDQQVKLISESIDTLVKKQGSAYQSFQNCKNLNTLQKYLSQSGSNQDKLSKNISELFDGQQKQNKRFELDLKEYFQIINKELTNQQNLIDNFISSLSNFSTKNENFVKDIPNQFIEFQKSFMYGPSLLKDVSQIQTHNLYSSYPMTISLNDSKFISLKSNNTRQNQVCYINLEIDQNKKYELLLDFKSNNYNSGNSNLRLSPKTTFNTSPFNYNIFIPFVDKINQTHYKIDKGININQKKSEMKNLKIQVELRDHTFRWKFDDNINSQQDWRKLIQNTPYYFLFYFYQNENGEIIIKSLKEVEQFEKW